MKGRKSVDHFKRAVHGRLKQVREFGVEFGADPSPTPTLDAAKAKKTAQGRVLWTAGGVLAGAAAATIVLSTAGFLAPLIGATIGGIAGNRWANR